MSRATAVVGMQMVLDKKDKEIAKLKARVAELEAAIREHRPGFDLSDATEEDRQLWRVLVQEPSHESE